MAGGSSPRESPGNFNSIELNESTLTSIVRRVYDSMQSTSEPRGDPGNLCTSVEGEMASRFCLPRRRDRGQGQSNLSCSNSTPRYNPQVNYGHGGLVRGKCKGKGKGKSGNVKEAVLHKKELILLPSPKYDHVPRFERKRKLQDLGLIVDGFPLDKSWDENQLRLKVLCKLKCVFYIVQ